MVSSVYSHPYDRDERLSRLGTTREEWIEVTKAVVAGRSGATDNDPISAGGYLAYLLGTRRMREIFRAKGLEKEALDGIETVVDHKRKLRFAVVSTDAGTANIHRSPRNRTHKGPASKKAVDLNCQYELGLYDRDGNPLPGKESGDGYAFWYLCVFDDGESVRAELSSPVEFESGHFVKFSERIFILGADEWDEIIVSDPDEDSRDEDSDGDYQIDISRK